MSLSGGPGPAPLSLAELRSKSRPSVAGGLLPTGILGPVLPVLRPCVGDGLSICCTPDGPANWLEPVYSAFGVVLVVRRIITPFVVTPSLPLSPIATSDASAWAGRRHGYGDSFESEQRRGKS